MDEVAGVAVDAAHHRGLGRALDDRVELRQRGEVGGLAHVALDELDPGLLQPRQVERRAAPVEVVEDEQIPVGMTAGERDGKIRTDEPGPAGDQDPRHESRRYRRAPLPQPAGDARAGRGPRLAGRAAGHRRAGRRRGGRCARSSAPTSGRVRRRSRSRSPGTASRRLEGGRGARSPSTSATRAAWPWSRWRRAEPRSGRRRAAAPARATWSRLAARWLPAADAAAVAAAGDEREAPADGGRAAGATRREVVFYAAWTRHEARAKCTGAGLSGPPPGPRSSPSAGHRPGLRRRARLDRAPTLVQRFEFARIRHPTPRVSPRL